MRFDFGAIVKEWVVREAPRLKANHLQAMRLRKEAALYDAAATLDGAKPTPEERMRRTAIDEELEGLESVEHFDLGKYRVLYIPKKGFRLTRAHRQRGQNSVTFFDAMPFYSTGISEAVALDFAARRYLGEGKSAAEEGLDLPTLGRDPAYYAAHREAVIRYCLRDCALTARLFEKTIAGFEEIGIPFPRQPWSRASVGREVLKRLGVLEATREAYLELDKTGHARFWRGAYAGACILTRGVGTWDDVTKLDLNSAYPAPMPSFPSLEGAYLVGPESPKFDGCYFKFYEIDLVPTPRRALRSKDRASDHLLYHVGGEPRRVCVTGLDLDAFDEWGDRYTIVEAVGVVTPSGERPLAYMREVYAAKDRIKLDPRYGEESVEYQNVKIMLNGTYGILTQSKPREGRYTNFIYGAYITAWTRREIWRKAREVEAKGGTMLSFMTDGMLVSGLTDLPPSSRELGAWEVKDVGSATLFANGIYVVSGKLKRRGAPDLTLPLLRKCRRPWVHVERSGPLGLKQAIIRGTPELIGVWTTEEKDLVPWRMLEDSGLRVPTDLRSAPLRSFFVDSWYLDHRSPTEELSPPSLLPIVEAP